MADVLYFSLEIIKFKLQSCYVQFHMNTFWKGMNPLNYKLIASLLSEFLRWGLMCIIVLECRVQTTVKL